MEQRRTDESRIGLGRAVLYSVVAHILILLVLSFVWPEAEPARSSEPDEVAVTFDLTEDQIAALPEPIAEEVPEPAPEDQPAEEVIPETDLFKPFVEEDQANSDVPTNPRPSALGVPEPITDTTDPEPVEEPPVPEVLDVPLETDDRPEPEPIEDILEQSEPQPVAPEDVVTDDADRAEDTESSEEAPEGAALPTDRGEVPEPTEQTGERRLDVDRAIRDLFSNPPKQRETKQEEGDQGSRGGMEMPELDRLPSSGFGLDRNLFFESKDYDWSDYSRAIYMAIWRAWHNRLWQTTNQFERWAYSERSWMLEHQVLIRWVIHRNGRISEIAIVTPSGCVPLDDSAVNAMEEVVIQPLPSDFPRDKEQVHGRFIAVGDIRDIKRTLDMYKRAGWF